VRGAALAVGLAVLLAAGSADAQPEVKRIPANDPATVAAGVQFAMQERLLRDEPDAEAAEVRALGGPEKLMALRASLHRMGPDGLADRYMRSLDGVHSTALTASVLRGMYKDDAVFRSRVESATNLVHLSDGTQRAMPLPLAAVAHRAELRLAARLLAETRPATARSSGASMLAAAGHCPVAAGPVELAMQGSLVEVTRQGRLLLAGALGRTLAVFLAVEQRFASVTQNPETKAVTVEVPDRPSELYVARMGVEPLTLAGTVFKGCTMTLIRPEAPPAK
jgi:hypothetical protein